MIDSSVKEVQSHMEMHAKYIEAEQKNTKKQYLANVNESEFNMSITVYEFFRLLAVCHTVVLEIEPDGNIQY